jgi:hypothetical protein
MKMQGLFRFCCGMNLWEKDGAFLETALADEQADMGDRASLPWGMGTSSGRNWNNVSSQCFSNPVP